MDSPIKNVPQGKAAKAYIRQRPLEQPEASSSTASRGHLNDSEVPQFSFELPHQYSHGKSVAPLIDYALFETPVDISLGTLPPRPTNSRAITKGRIPRPRNAFMLFRSEFHRQRRVDKAIEKDHRHISRIIGICWSALSEEEKNVWRQTAELEKQQHAREYPEYRYKPTPRLKQPVKRNVKRNTPKEIERCQKIADLITNGKSGEELTDAVKSMEGGVPLVRAGYGPEPVPEGTQWLKYDRSSRAIGRSVGHHSSTHQQFQPPSTVPADDLPFRSPLLPPENIGLPVVPGLSSYTASASSKPGPCMQEDSDHFPHVTPAQSCAAHQNYQQGHLQWNVRSHLPPPQDWPSTECGGNIYGYVPSIGEQYVALMPSPPPNTPSVAVESVKDQYQVSYPHPMEFSPMQTPWNAYPPSRSFSRAITPNLYNS